MINIGFAFLIFIICFTLNSCKPKKDYESISKFIYQLGNVEVFNIDSIDHKRELDSFVKYNYSSNYGVYYDLDSFKISNDSGKYECKLPLFFYGLTDPACRESPTLKLKLLKDSFNLNDTFFYYDKMKEFETYLNLKLKIVFKTREFQYYSKWNEILINDSTSFKKQLFPVLNTMYSTYLSLCLADSNLNFSRSSKGNIKDFYTEVTTRDVSPPAIKSTIQFTPPKIVN